MSNKINNQEIAETIANSSEFLTNLIYCSEYDSYYLWDNFYFKLLDGFELRKIIHLFMAKNFPKINITESLVADIIKAVRYYINIVRETPDFSRIAFKDKNFNLETFDFEPHSKQNLAVFNFNYNSEEINSPIPVWENFLKTSLVKEETTNPDIDLIDFVQEMFGYFILPSLKGSSAFFLVGGGSNGKSVMVKVLEQMFGKPFCSSMSVQKLTTNNWAPAHLVGKKINISNEDESKHIKPDVFKALVTGDTISAERKFGDPFEFEPNTKFVFCTNEMPSFEGFNYGLKRRLKMIPFYRRFLDHEQDKELQEKLSKEIPGIIGWAIDGAIRFTQNNRKFNEAKASMHMLTKFIEDNSSALSFFNEYYIIDNGYKTANCDVYDEYKEWCNDNGRKPLSSSNFWKEIKKEYGGKLQDAKAIRIKDGARVNGKNVVKNPEDNQLNF